MVCKFEELFYLLLRHHLEINIKAKLFQGKGMATPDNDCEKWKNKCCKLETQLADLEIKLKEVLCLYGLTLI